jgi:hypothetical protein
LRAGAFGAGNECERERLVRGRGKLFVEAGHAKVLARWRAGFNGNLLAGRFFPAGSERDCVPQRDQSQQLGMAGRAGMILHRPFCGCCCGWSPRHSRAPGQGGTLLKW